MPLGIGFRRFNRSGTAPTFVQASNVDPSGGVATVLGTNFRAGAQVIIGGGVGAAATTVNSSTNISITVPAAAAGNYDVYVVNSDGSMCIGPGGLLVSAVSDPATILGTALKLWFKADGTSNTNSGGYWTGIHDYSANGNNATNIVNVAYNSSDSAFSGFPSFGFNGSTSGLRTAGVNLGGQIVFMMLAIRQSAAGSYPYICYWSNATLAEVSTNGMPTIGNSTPATWTSSIVGSSVSVQAYSVGNGSNYVSVNNGTAVTGTTASASNTNPADVVVGATFSGTTPNGHYLTGTIAEIIIANIDPSTAQKAALAKYLNLKYQLSADPTFATSTLMDVTGGSFRISGANFIPGAVVAVSGLSGSPTLTTTYVSSTILEVAVPAGTYTAGNYTLTITNPDGGIATVLSGLTITDSSVADDIMQVLGTNCVLWLDSDNLTQSSGSVTAMTDRSLRGHNPTALNNVGYSASDAAYSGKPSFSFNGSTSSIGISTFTAAAAAGMPMFGLVVEKITTGASFAYSMNYVVGGVDRFRFDQDATTPGKPHLIVGGTGVSWTAAISGAHAVYASNTGGTGTTTSSINVDNGTAQTVSSSIASAISNSGSVVIGARSTTPTNAFTGTMAMVVFANVVPTSAQLTRLQAIIHARYGI